VILTRNRCPFQGFPSEPVGQFVAESTSSPAVHCSLKVFPGQPASTSRSLLPPYRFPRLRGFSLQPGLSGILSAPTNLSGVSLRFRALLPIRILCPSVSISAAGKTRSPRKVPRFFGGFLPPSGYSPSQAFLATLPFPRTSWSFPNDGPVDFKRNLAVTNLVPPLKLHPSEVSLFRQPSPSRGTCPRAVFTASGPSSNGKSLDDANG
jgi:hypothetical protein